MKLLYVFMSSSKAHELYLKKQTELYPTKQIRQLQQLSDTRWACRYFAVDAVCCTYDAIIPTLEDISNSDNRGKAVEARGILCQVKSFKFLLLLVIFSQILSFTKSLSDQLQSVTNHMARSADLKHLKRYVQQLMGSFAKIYPGCRIIFLCHLHL